MQAVFAVPVPFYHGTFAADRLLFSAKYAKL
jgi:hypothetical protein